MFNLKKNNSLYSEIKQSPLEVIFGKDAQNGFKHELSPEIYQNTLTKENLEKIINNSSRLHIGHLPQLTLIKKNKNIFSCLKKCIDVCLYSTFSKYFFIIKKIKYKYLNT